jgi:hypothetical protein
MANLVAADVSYTNLKRKKIEDNRKIVQANISFGDGVKTYPPGGVPLLGKMLDCPVVVDSLLIDDMNSATSMLIKHDAVNNTLRLYSIGETVSGPVPPVGSPAMGTSRTFAILGASAVTNTGSSVLTGDLGIYPNGSSSITGFPPGTYSGTLHAGDAYAQQAQASALAAYTDLQARPSTVIATELGGQSLTAGVYSSAGGTFTLTGGLTLTLTGSATDIFVFQTATTLATGVGAGGIPVITLAGGALASNVYWAVGSSATLNSAASSAGGVFKGNLLAQTSITATQVGTLSNTVVALTGAVTLSAANNVSATSSSISNGELVGGSSAVPAISIKVEAKGY